MSRYCGEKETGQILKAAEHWQKDCLEMDGSVFSEASLWTIEHLREVEKYFVNRLDEGEGNFNEKLKAQLEPASPGAKKLVAEMMWVMQLCPSNLGFETKLDAILMIWSWSGESLPEGTPWTKPEVLSGIGSSGVSYHVLRWRELVFFTNLLISFKSLGDSEREKLFREGWAFGEWLESLPDEKNRQLRFMLLFLLFPDSFERIFGGSDRYQIASHFSQKPKSDINETTPLMIDRELQLIRSGLEEKYQTKELDFYVPPLVALWKTPVFKASTSGVQKEHVLRALERGLRRSL